MTAASILKTVRKAYPEVFESLPKPKLRLVENAILYASQLLRKDELLSSKEHQELLKKLTGKSQFSPGDRIKAYRMRENLTQVELSQQSEIPQANISAMESGRRPVGSLIAKKLAKVLRCDYRQFL